MYQAYPKTTLTLVFVSGILLTLGLKDFYPDLERRLWARRKPRSSSNRRIALWDDDPPAGEFAKNETAEKNDRRVPEGIEGSIGNTPLFKIRSLSDATGCEIFAKAEMLNGAGGSPKARVALSIIEKAEAEGLLTPHSGDTVYEGTVGSTGIALATICRARGYLAHITMPSDQSTEKSALLLALGAIVERVQPAPIVDPDQFVNAAKRRAQEHTLSSTQRGRGFFADQFENEANWRAHYESTGPEIYDQMGGDIDCFVSGAGTGGTISGVGMYLKEKMGPEVKIVLADPQGSGLYNKVKYGVMFDAKEKEGTRRRHQVDSVVEGIGVNRLTRNFEVGSQKIDDAVRVTDNQAVKMARFLVEKDGIFAGSSTAVNSVKYAMELGPGHRIATIICDSGSRHMSRFWKLAGEVGDKTDTSIEEVLEL